MKLNLALATTAALAFTNNVAATVVAAEEELEEVKEMVAEEQVMLAKLEALDLTRFDTSAAEESDGDIVIDFDDPDLGEPVAVSSELRQEDGVAEPVPVLISAEPDDEEVIVPLTSEAEHTTLKEGKAKKPTKSHHKKTKSPSAYSKSSSLEAPPVHTKSGKSQLVGKSEKPVDHKGKSSKRAKSHSMSYEEGWNGPPAKHHPRPDSKAHKGTYVTSSNSTTTETMATEPAIEEPAEEYPDMTTTPPPEYPEPIDENTTEPVLRGTDTSDMTSDNSEYKKEVAELILSGLGVGGNLEDTTGQSINIGKGHQQNQNVEALDLLREKAEAKKAALANGSVGRSSLVVGGVCLLGSIVYGLMV